MFSQDIDVTVEKAPNNDKGGLTHRSVNWTDVR